MLSRLIPTVAALIAVPAFAMLLNSGLEKGESVTPFHPDHISGPLAGTNKCFPCTFGKRPAVQVWVNGDDSKNVERFVQTLQKNMDSHRGAEFKALVVVVTADKNSAKARLGKLVKGADANAVDIALIAPDHEAVKAYKISLDPNVKNTVLVYKDWMVQDKFVNLKMDEKGASQLSSAIDSLVK